jgi:hypothetical protein
LPELADILGLLRNLPCGCDQLLIGYSWSCHENTIA